jgi:hypothetical protein
MKQIRYWSLIRILCCSASRTSQPLQTVARRKGKLGEVTNPIDLIQFATRGWPKFLRTGVARRARFRAVKNIFRSSIVKRTYHALRYNIAHYTPHEPITDMKCHG